MSDPQAPPSPQPDPPRRWWPLAGAALVVFALGLAVGLLAPALRTPDDASADAGFARDMATHHAQAVEMAMIVHARTDDPEVATLAMDIALTQQAQIGIMRTWLTQWGLPPTGSQPAMTWMRDMASMDHGDGQPAPAGTMPGLASKAEISQLRESTGGNLNIRFADLMVRHHRGGITMVDAILSAEPRPEVRDLATRMRAGQQAEITALETLRNRLHASAASDAPTD
ncbi:DUF305 domain-containing protein [Micromonospora sp. WMMD1155]|uniref:DUF305 domain-containing protein n=1 Tax=Micromonospora sp. WMMD1155 TaxID=3016094 RepID=UPI00249B2B43|nr:DUF305 domain-containing protein [Micromonospora sp. WMMD1155]WFE53079.1 DUF305 domain-containing protein [Micromonospora sp. WMMD1155]